MPISSWSYLTRALPPLPALGYQRCQQDRNLRHTASPWPEPIFTLLMLLSSNKLCTTSTYLPIEPGLSSRVDAVLRREVPNVETFDTLGSVCSVKRYGKKAQSGEDLSEVGVRYTPVLAMTASYTKDFFEQCGRSLAVQLLLAML